MILARLLFCGMVGAMAWLWVPDTQKTAEDIIEEKILVAASGCWEWQGSMSAQGYGRITFEGKYLYAHRFVYETLRAKIPKGMQIDHLCENKACVNPKHLEVVTPRQNTIRAVRSREEGFCKRGHDMRNPYNVTQSSAGADICRICTNAWHNERQKRVLREDPVQAEKIRARDRERYAFNMEDPEFREKERVRNLARFHAKKAKAK